MNELDEGVFGWMTVNYLLGQLNQPKKSYVALDLGGGSTQITFLPKYEETISSSSVGYDACMKEVNRVIDNLDVDKCEEVPTRKIAAFSYFHDRAVDAGLLSPGERG